MFDVAVLGAGPAGSAAAISLAGLGLRVVIVEASIFPRNRPGETLHPGVEPILAQLGVRDEIDRAMFIRHDGIYVAWNRPTTFIPYGNDGTNPWLGFQAWRGDFDRILLDRACSLGISLMQPCVAKQPILQRGRVAGLVTSEGDVRARFVLDASGSVAWLARRLCIPVKAGSRRLTAHYGYVANVTGGPSQLPLLRKNQDGWTWIARTQCDRYNWTTLCIDSVKSTVASVPRELRSARLLSPARIANVTWREVLRPAGSGYFLLGDAAAILDPLSSHGVLRALMSGIWASHLIGQIGRGLSERDGAAAYSQWIRRWFHHDSKNLRRHYHQAGLDVELEWQHPLHEVSSETNEVARRDSEDDS